MGTKLKSGDFILALGQINNDFIGRYLQEKSKKLIKSNKSNRKLSNLLRRQQTINDKKVLNGLSKEFSERIKKLSTNIDLLKEQNKDLAETI